MSKLKRVLALTLAVLLALSFCACGREEAGGWTKKNAKPTDAETEAFDKAVRDTEYADYTLEKTLGTQVVAGVNYKFLCKTPDGEKKVMIVYQDTGSNCTVSSVENYK